MQEHIPEAADSPIAARQGLPGMAKNFPEASPARVGYCTILPRSPYNPGCPAPAGQTHTNCPAGLDFLLMPGLK